MKIRLIKAHGQFKVGHEMEVQASDAAVLLADGFAVDAVQAAENANLQKRLKDQGVTILTQKHAEAVKRGAVEPKNEAVLAKAIERFNGGADLNLLCELYDGMPGKVQASLSARHTPSMRDELPSSGVEVVNASLSDAATGYIKASNPQDALIRSGRMDEARELSLQASSIVSRHFRPIIRAGGDFDFRDIVKAADVTDPDSNVGTLQTGLILMRNLGFLKSKLNWMPYLTTDLRNEPATFGQPILTRYITPANVLTFIPGVGYTSDSSTISTAGATTTQAGIATQASGTLTKSVAKSTDKTVTMDQHKAVEIEFPVNKLGSTLRNLFAEQYSAQLYSLAEEINKRVLSVILGATWTPQADATSAASTTNGTSSKSLGQFSLTGMVGLKLSATINRIPDLGRFAMMHSIYHDQMLTDTNLVTAKAILAMINKDMSAFESGELPVLYGIKPLESQLAASKGASGIYATLVTPTDPTTIAAVADKVGFVGNSASALFVARVPQDYTQALTGVPATAALEIVTEPDSGLSVLVTKYVNHERASATQRVALMYGAAQGDPRQGFVLTP